MATNNYLSTLKPSFKSTTYNLGKIPAYQYKGTLKEEIAAAPSRLRKRLMCGRIC